MVVYEREEIGLYCMLRRSTGVRGWLYAYAGRSGCTWLSHPIWLQELGMVCLVNCPERLHLVDLAKAERTEATRSHSIGIRHMETIKWLRVLYRKSLTVSQVGASDQSNPIRTTALPRHAPHDHCQPSIGLATAGAAENARSASEDKQTVE